MPPNSEYEDYVLRQLEPLGPFRVNRCFGGLGISIGSVRFAMVMGDRVYVVVDDTTRPVYEQAGMSIFSYMTKKGRTQLPRYYQLPDDVLANARQLRMWINDAIIAADRPKASTAAKKTRPQVKER